MQKAGEISIERINENGQFMPLLQSEDTVIESKKNFKSVQPMIDYTERLNRIRKFFPGAVFLSAEEFKERRKRLFEQLQADPIFSNLLNGVWFPVAYPQFKVSDYGGDFENVFLKALSDSYKSQYPKRRFYNHRKGKIKGKVEIVDESHKRFISMMGEGSIVGIQFFPWNGFSIEAERELMLTLPGCFYLSGLIDLAIAISTYPDFMVCDFNTQGYNCSAVALEYIDYSLYMKADDKELGIGRTDGLEHVRDNYSGGLVYLG